MNANEVNGLAKAPIMSRRTGATLDLHPASQNDTGARRVYVDAALAPMVSVMVQMDGKLYRWERSLLAMSFDAFSKLPLQDKGRVLAALRITDAHGYRVPMWAHEQVLPYQFHYSHYLIALGTMLGDRGISNVTASYADCPNSWTNAERDRLDKNG